MNHSDTPACTCTSPPPVKLTGRELETLHWVMMGKTAWEIGRILGRSEAAIKFHQNNIRRKFGACTMRTAMVKAIELGIIPVGDLWFGSRQA